MVECYDAIVFRCEKCGSSNLCQDSLSQPKVIEEGDKEMLIRDDYILCEKCLHDNHVVKILFKYKKIKKG